MVGALRTNNYETRDGDKRSSIELTATEIGASVQFAQIKIVKPARTSVASAADAHPGGDDEQPPF